MITQGADPGPYVGETAVRDGRAAWTGAAFRRYSVPFGGAAILPATSTPTVRPALLTGTAMCTRSSPVLASGSLFDTNTAPLPPAQARVQGSSSPCQKSLVRCVMQTIAPWSSVTNASA